MLFVVCYRLVNTVKLESKAEGIPLELVFPCGPCYVPAPQRLIVHSDGVSHQITATDCASSRTVWRLEGRSGGAHHRPAVHRVPPVARGGASGGRGELAGAGAGPRLRARPHHPAPPGHGLGVGPAPPLPRFHPAVPPLHPQPGARHRHAHHLILLYQLIDTQTNK